MKKPTFLEKMQYQFDIIMGKGTAALVGLLFAATALIVVLAGVGVMILLPDSGSLGSNIWASVMYVIDAGTITAADTENIAFIVLMSLVTLCGIFVTSILIGIITTGFEEKLQQLKKGNSRVIEKNHTVILGFDANAFTLISELIIANENQKDGCIVLLTEQDKEAVEQAIAAEIADFKTTRVICRTGSIADAQMLKNCSIETCKSIIINEESDLLTVKAVLAVTSYLKQVIENSTYPYIVTTIHQEMNRDAIKIIAQDNCKVILVQDSIARIIAQTCRQPGLSNVLIELFDYDGDELYFEYFPELTGKTFGTALCSFEKAVVFGVKRGTELLLNPNQSFVLEQEDALLLLVEDDGAAKLSTAQVRDIQTLQSTAAQQNEPENILILGKNNMVPQVIKELDEYFTPGSNIVLASDMVSDEYAEIQKELKNITLICETFDIDNHENLRSLVQKGITHVLLLSDDDCDSEISDAKTLLRLVHLRDIAKKEQHRYSITSEMKKVENQRLAEVAQANDLVIGSNILNLIMTQISENADLLTVFNDLLDAQGNEIYMRKASHYLALDTTMDFYDVTTILMQSGEIAVGYKKQMGDTYEIITNPAKSQKISFTKDDYIISVAEN